MSRDDVVYAAPGARELCLDIYAATGSVDHRTAVVAVHGGGWRVGDRKMLRSRCQALADRGFTVLSAEYRLLDEAPWPAQLHDVRAAIGWTRDQAADLGVDADRIVVQGHSAGAHLALMAAAATGPALDLDAEALRTPIAAVVAYYPTVELVSGRPMPDMSAGPTPESLAALRSEDGTGPAAMLLGDSAGAQDAAAASPITYAAPGHPATILLHGTADRLVAPAASERLHHKLLAADVASELHLFSGAHHEFDATPSLTETCSALVTDFLARVVLEPAAFADEVRQTNPMAAMFMSDESDGAL